MTEAIPIVAGSGRSGTTWILDSLASANDLRPVFEPLHPVAVRQARTFAQRYLPSDAVEPELERFLTRVFFQDFGSLWVDYRIRRDLLVPGLATVQSIDGLKRYYRRWKKSFGNLGKLSEPRRRRGGRIVKFIHANLMLDWIAQHFEAHIVLVLRHPAAVVESELRLGEVWEPYQVLRRYREDRLFMDRFGDFYGKLLEENLTPAKAFTLIWCIENQVPFSEEKQHQVSVVYYEDLIASPKSEWGRITQLLGLKNVPDQNIRSRPSTQASQGWRTGVTLSNSLERWKGRLRDEDQSEIQEILDKVGVSVYSTEEALPIGSGSVAMNRRQ